MADRMTQMLRSDARDNRDRLLEAARELFSERGLDVPKGAKAFMRGEDLGRESFDVRHTVGRATFRRRGRDEGGSGATANGVRQSEAGWYCSVPSS